MLPKLHSDQPCAVEDSSSKLNLDMRKRMKAASGSKEFQMIDGDGEGRWLGYYQNSHRVAGAQDGRGTWKSAEAEPIRATPAKV